MAQMVKLYSNGMLLSEIAELMKTSSSTVSRILKKQGMESRHPALTSDRKAKILELYKSGYNKTQISKMLKTTRTTVGNVLIENNVQPFSNSKIHQIFKLNENYFENIDTPSKAYILGLLYADGNISGNLIRLSLQEKDLDIIQKIKEKLGSNHPIKFIRYKDKNPNWQNQYCLSITNKKMRDDLVSHGMFPAKSLNLVFPEDLAPELYSHFMRGYFDGDGYISKNWKEKRISIVGTEQFCTKIKEILEDLLEVHCSISFCHGNKLTTTRTLGVAGGKQVKKVLDWIYQDAELYIYRKYQVYEKLYCN